MKAYRDTPGRRTTAAQLAASVRTSLRLSETLFADGYRIRALPGRPTDYGVWKPDQADTARPAYTLRVWSQDYVDRRTGEMRPRFLYNCGCPLYHEQERHQLNWDSWWAHVSEAVGLDAPACKHGAALVARIEGVLPLIEHLPEDALRTLFAHIIWDRPAEPPPPPKPPKPVMPERRVGDDNLIWHQERGFKSCSSRDFD